MGWDLNDGKVGIEYDKMGRKWERKVGRVYICDIGNEEKVEEVKRGICCIKVERVLSGGCMVEGIEED
ncbi:spore germination protein [Bacillus sp. WP8]|uniref:spore germination protein n=1 Tax=Bacillus sp. WP8 TaxID=756828 RepID=UPI0011A37B25|nr:spore germination protein [Bacillus sp. WP8]